MKRFFIKFVGFMLIGVLLFFMSGTYWGVWGEIDDRHFDLILASLPPWQKQELAEALNYYNNNNNSAMNNNLGPLLRCLPESESIKRQFNWFYRRTVSVAANPSPTYHQMAQETYNQAFRGEIHRLRYESTLDYELALARKYKKTNIFTRNNLTGIEAGGTSGAARWPTMTVNPFFGAAMSLLTLIQSSLNDTMRAVPGTICFMQIRCCNFLYSFAALWLLTGGVMLLVGRGKGKGKKASPSSSGKKKPAAKKK